VQKRQTQGLGEQGVTINEYGESLWGDENNLELDSYVTVMLILLYDYTKKPLNYTLPKV
jgi:hypothetical protein